MLPFLCCTVCKVIGSYICSFARSAWNLHFVANWFYALFLCDGTCKPLLTSKPSLTIALKISKTIEKPLKPMVGPSKNIQWWWSNSIKTIEKPLMSMVVWKKTLTIPSLLKIDHRRGLLCNIFKVNAEFSQLCTIYFEIFPMIESSIGWQIFDPELSFLWHFQLSTDRQYHEWLTHWPTLK